MLSDLLGVGKEKIGYAGLGSGGVRQEKGELTCGQIHHRDLDPRGRVAIAGSRVRVGCMLRCVWSAMGGGRWTPYSRWELRPLRSRQLDKGAAGG